MEKTTIDLGKEVVTITLQDAQQIRAAANKYLVKNKSKFDKQVTPPGDPFIDCEGTVRMGVWMLEQSFSDPELQLTYLIAWNQWARFGEYIRIKRVAGRWKAVGKGDFSAHRH